MDISPVYVRHAVESVLAAGFLETRFEFRVMDAHELEYQDETFDIAIGVGILHHLDAVTALKELRRVLKPGGRVLLHEPLAGNPLLKLFRLLTPNARTKDESPFTGTQIKTLIENQQWKSDLIYCGLLEAPVAVLTSLLIPNHPDNVLLHFADKIEHWTHERKILLSWNQYVLFNLLK